MQSHLRNRISLILLNLFLSIICHAQIGVNTTTPDSNAALDISSANNKGLLIPRGDSLTRNALDSNKAKGLMLYDTLTNSIWLHTGNGNKSGWQNLRPAAPSAIIPYSFGNADFATGPAGTPATTCILGLSSFVINPFTTSIAGGFYPNTAVLIPRHGIITSFAMYINFSNNYSFSAPISFTAEIYMADSSPGGSNTFTPVPGTQMVLSFPANVTTTTFASITRDLSVPLTPGSRFLFVVYASGPASATTRVNINGAVAIN